MSPDVRTFADAQARAFRSTESYLEHLAGQYDRVIRAAGVRAATKFSEQALTAAAGDVPWVVPPIDELVDVTRVTQELLGATETTRKAASSSATRPILSAMGVSFSLEAPMVKDLVGRTGVRAAALSIPGLQDAVRDAITTAFAEGLSVPQTAALIAQKANGLATYQSEMLARTDLIGTANGGSLLAAKATWPEGGIVKRWTNATNSRTENDGHIRPTHLEANGQVVGLDDRFLVGEDALLFPGDPGGTDAEVCNCRCTIVYEEAVTAALDDPFLRDIHHALSQPITDPGEASATVETKIILTTEQSETLAAAWDEMKHPRQGRGSDRGGEFATKPTGDVVNKMVYGESGVPLATLQVGDLFMKDGVAWTVTRVERDGLSVFADDPHGTQREFNGSTETTDAFGQPAARQAGDPPEGAIEVTGKTLKVGSTFWGMKNGEWVKYEVAQSAGGLGRYVRVRNVATGDQMVMKSTTKVTVDPADFPAAAKRLAKVGVNHVEGEYGKAFGKSPGPGTKVTKAANAASAETGELLTINTNDAKPMAFVETRAETFGGALYTQKLRTTGEYVPVKLALRAGEPAEMRDNMHHEMGHYIDYAGLDTVVGQTASETKHPDIAGPVMEAIDNSRAVARINDMRGTGFRQGSSDYSVVTNDGTALERNFPVDRGHINYLSTSTEKFARAYEQYIATKTAAQTGDISRLERYRRDAAAPPDVKRLTESSSTSFKGFYGWYWDGDDFVPIMRAFDDMFGRAGWLKN